MLLIVTVMLVALAAVNAIFITRATVQDSRHTSAVTRALGARSSLESPAFRLQTGEDVKMFISPVQGIAVPATAHPSAPEGTR